MAQKVLFILILLLCTISKANCASIQSGFVKYQENTVGKADCIIVLPIDGGFFNSNISSYSSTINMISNDIINEARAKAEEITQQVRSEIVQEVGKAKKEIESDLASIAASIAQRVLGREVA